MILTRRGKIFVASAIAGTIIAFTLMYIVATQQATVLESDIAIDITDIDVTSYNPETDTLTLQVTFQISNNSDVVMSLGIISYDLFGNDINICKSGTSYRDVPLVGRPQIFSHGISGPIRTNCDIKRSAQNTEIFDTLLNNNLNSIRFNTKGTTEIETSISVITKSFDIVY